MRDAARKHHPVIGIAALGNCVVQLSERDQAIGWNLEAVEKNLQRRHRVVTRDLPKDSLVRRATETQYLETGREHKNRIRRYATCLAQAMFRSLEHEFSLINLQGLATEDECSRPTDALVRRFLEIAQASERERQDGLRESHAKGTRVKRTDSESSVSEDTASPLYVKKRAQALADILFARLVFLKEGLLDTPVPALQRLLISDEGRKAIRIGLHSNKVAVHRCSSRCCTEACA